jgi:galactokinase
MTSEAEMRTLFQDIYRADECVVASAPGRVNIIGEHTDYNDGFVLPTPIGSRLFIAGRRRTDDEFHLYAYDYCEDYAFTLGEQTLSKDHSWANYPMGVVDAIQRKGYPLRGADLLIKGDVPQAAGLSSSAALEVATARVLVELYNIKIDPVELAYLGKAAENDFIGLKSGIMDQFCASLGEQGQALLIDCRSNEHRNIKIPAGYTLIAVHTGIKRKLDSSAYNERVQQCRTGVEAIHMRNPTVKSLRDASMVDVTKAAGDLSEVVYRRCLHVVTENRRVLSAVEAMEAGDAAKLGALMYESHKSLRDDYGVSCRELDVLVEIASATDYVLGARLTGAGFGGCTINLLPRHNLTEFVEEVTRKYQESTGIRPEVYPI